MSFIRSTPPPPPDADHKTTKNYAPAAVVLVIINHDSYNYQFRGSDCVSGDRTKDWIVSPEY